MDFVRLWSLLLVTLILAIWEVRAASRRQKKDNMILRRLELLTKRFQNIELELQQEKHKSELLREELDKVKNTVITSEEKPKSRARAGELPAAVKTLSDLARKTFQTDLAVLRSGMIAEKQRAVHTENAIQLCKMTLKSHSSRFDAIDGRLSQLEYSMTNLNTTAMTVNKSCSQCSAHPPGTEKDFTSDKCPLSERLLISKQTPRNLGTAVCKSRNFAYALYVTVENTTPSPDSEPHKAEVTIVDMVKIGGGYIQVSGRTSVSLSRDCPWPNIEEREHYLILTDQALKKQDQRSTLSLMNSVIVNVMYDRPPYRYDTKLLYDLRRRNWGQLCRSRK